MATISNTPRPAYAWDSTDNVWYPIGTGAHSHGEIPATIVDAKGDLIVGTGADTVARKAVGADGSYLVADSTQTTGVNWAGQPYANPVLNSAMQVWQRGTSFSATGSYPYTADRWIAYRATGNATVSRQVTNDITNLPNIQYCARVQRTAATTGTDVVQFTQIFESVNSIPFAGKTVNLSFYARAGATYSAASGYLSAKLATGTGTDQNPYVTYTGQTNSILTNVTLTTTWQRFTVSVAAGLTATLPTTTTEMFTAFEYTPVGTAGATDYFEITGVQIDLGSVALPFRTYAGTYQGELAACQRYYWKATDQFMIGGSSSSTSAFGVLNYPVTMRTAPAVTNPAASSLYYAANGYAGAPTAVSAFQIRTNLTYFTFTISGATAWSAGTISYSGTASFEFSAEL